jgi:5-methylcytosine-specific restriction protein A
MRRSEGSIVQKTTASTSMPNAPKRPCRTPGCPALVDSGYCPDHVQHRNDNDRSRGSASSRGYDASWKRLRLVALKRDRYLCVSCLAAGRLVAAVDVDHIRTVKAAPDLRLDVTNLQSLCKSCHRRKTANEQRNYDERRPHSHYPQGIRSQP